MTETCRIDLREFVRVKLVVEDAVAAPEPVALKLYAGLIGVRWPRPAGGVLLLPGHPSFQLVEPVENEDHLSDRPSWLLFGFDHQKPLTVADPAKKQVYYAAVRRAVDDYVNTAFLVPMLEQAYSQIREAVIADTKKPNSNDDFELSIEGLRGVIDSRRGDVTRQLPGPEATRR